MNEQPFPFIVSETRPRGILEVYAEFVRPANEGALRHTRLLMQSFASIVRAGVFAPVDHPRPVNPTLRIEREELGADSAHWIIEDVHAALGSAAVLHNVFAHVHRNIVSLAGVTLSADPALGIRHAGASVPAQALPAPFHYRFEAVEASDLVIEVEFEKPVPDAAVRQRFVDLWSAWLYIAAFGGFRNAGAPPGRPAAFPGGEPESYPDELVFYLEDVSLEPPAFSPLLNGFQHLHRTDARVRSVLIY